MKRKLAVTLISVFLVTMLLPVQAWAAYDRDLEKAISKAKALFNISKGYDSFDYSMHKQNDKTVFYLRWFDSKNRLGEISVTIDSTGKVTQYYSYKPYNEKDRRKLPAISKADALKVANQFVKKVAPEISAKVQYVQEEGPLTIYSEGYHFSFTRVENGVAYPENNISIAVDGMSGEVRNYYLNWYEKVKFPDTSGVMALDKAKQEFVDKLGLKLIYKMTADPKERKPYLVYSNVYSNQYIDAKTGEVVIGGGYIGIYQEKLVAGGDGLHSYASDQPVTLTPQEQKAVEGAADIIDQKKAEAAVRSSLKISQDFTLRGISLYKNWMSDDEYVWSLDFNKEANTREGQYEGISVSVDAKTGKILSFYKNNPYDPNAVPKYSREKSLKIAQDFIKAMQPEESKQVEQTPWDNPVYGSLKDEIPRQHYFTYTRKVNGAYFIGNGFNVTVDGVTGEVINYTFNWYNQELPLPKNMISAGQAHEILFKEVGFEPQYISLSANREEMIILPPEGILEPDIGLVYALKPGKPNNIDAVTGKLLDYNGKVYEGSSVAQYTDIKGHYAENQIKVLAEYGISLPGEKLQPNQAMTQKEFLFLLAKAVNPYMPVQSLNGMDEEEFQNNLLATGILKEGEWSPKAVLQRQDAVKFIVRALNYEKVAEIDNKIFKLPFKDTKNIRPGLIGYLAVGYGLNIFNGSDGYCKPDAPLTRAQGLVVIYNMLNVQ